MQQYGTLLKYLSSTKEMIWGFRVLGRWDLDFVFAAKSVLELDSFKNALLLKFNSIIEDYDIALVTHSYIYPRDYLVGARIKVIRKLLEPKEAMRLEDSDMRLIKCLSADAMMHIIDISKKTRLAINTVKRRMRYLESKNIILGYRIFIDTNKLGYNYYKLHLGLRRYTVQDVNKLQTFLEYKESVVFIDKSLGGDDLEVEIHLKSENEYASFLEELLNNFSAIIKDHFVIRFYEELVFRYMPGE
jgi:DNA-binding Lrp family transcriptional regulator